MICDHKTVIRDEGEITPIKTLILADANVIARKTTMKFNQFTGTGALNNNGAVMVMIAATR